MPEFAAYRDLMTGVGTMGEYCHICAANAGIEVLYQHIMISHLRKGQLPNFDVLLA